MRYFAKSIIGVKNIHITNLKLGKIDYVCSVPRYIFLIHEAYFIFYRAGDKAT